MVRRSSSPFKVNDLAYPIRVKFIVPPGGMMVLNIDTQGWLQTNMQPQAWAWGPAHGVGRQATAYYFRRVEDAQRFVDAFPQLELADGVR